MMGLETMTFAPDIIMMMQECDANQVKGHVHKTVLVMIILNCGINNKGLILTWAENGKCCIINCTIHNKYNQRNGVCLTLFQVLATKASNPTDSSFCDSIQGYLTYNI